MFYKITLTSSGGLNSENISQIKNYFSGCNHVYLTNEFGESGLNSHVEGIVEYETEHTANVTIRCRKLYAKMGLDVSSHSIRVKKVTHLVGAIIYATKELQEAGELLVLKGWKQSWIDKTIKDNVKNISFKVLKKKGTRLTQNTGAAVIHEWCLANNCRIEGKTDLIEVVKRMASEGYLFGSLKPKGILADVCALFGDGRAAAEFFANELHFIES